MRSPEIHLVEQQSSQTTSEPTASTESNCSADLSHAQLLSWFVAVNNSKQDHATSLMATRASLVAVLLDHTHAQPKS